MANDPTPLVFDQPPVPTPGPVRLAFGADPPAPPDLGVRLVFSQAPVATPGPVRLVFGDDGGTPAIPDATLHGSGCITGLRLHIGLRSATRLSGAGRITGLRLHLAARYDINVSRGGLRAELASHWQQGQPTAAGLGAAWQQAAPLRLGTLARWQQGTGRRAGVVLPWQEAEHLRAIAASHWQQGQPLRAAMRPHWQEAERHRAAVATRWQEAEHRRAALRSHWQDMLRLRAAVASHWQGAEHRAALLATGHGHATPTRFALQHHWQQAMRPLAGVSRPPTPPDPRPPCYDPALPARLVFDTPWIGDGRLVFVCEQAGPGPNPEPPQYVIPFLRVYMTVHSISAVLLPSLERVQLDNVSITSDDDGFGWHLTAAGPAHLLDQLAPAGGLPQRVRVTVDGIEWIFAMEPPERSRRFGANQAQVRGSSVTALLGAPHMPEQAWTSTLALTAQQIVEQALQYTGVTIDWGLNDWLVPAAAWSHQGSPLSVAQRVAEAAGAVVRSHRTDATLQFAPKYPHMPWDWPTAAANVRMPGQIITADTLQHVSAAHYNAIYVAGTTEGSPKGHVVRAGSAGDVLAPQITDALITHEIAARQRGSAVLAAAAITKRQPITVPLLTGGTNPGLILPGYLIEVVEPSETWRGLVRGITITAGMPTVRQALSVERAA